MKKWERRKLVENVTKNGSKTLVSFVSGFFTCDQITVQFSVIKMATLYRCHISAPGISVSGENPTAQQRDKECLSLDSS